MAVQSIGKKGRELILAAGHPPGHARPCMGMGMADGPCHLLESLIFSTAARKDAGNNSPKSNSPSQWLAIYYIVYSIASFIYLIFFIHAIGARVPSSPSPGTN
jgi:hypothetical protein